MAITAQEAKLYSNLTTGPTDTFHLKGGRYWVGMLGTMGEVP